MPFLSLFSRRKRPEPPRRYSYQARVELPMATGIHPSDLYEPDVSEPEVRKPKERRPVVPEKLRIAIVRTNDGVMARGASETPDDDILDELSQDGTVLGIWWVEVEVPDQAPKLSIDSK